MIIREIKFIPYKLKFISPLKTSKETFEYRKGFLIRLTDSGGNNFYGDVAPLVSFGTETLEDAKIKLTSIQALLTGKDYPDIFNFINSFELHGFPAVKFGIEQALINFAFFHNFKPVTEQFNSGEEIHIPVSGVIGISGKTECVNKIKEFIKLGIDTVKLKIGDDFNNDLNCINSILNLNNNVKLRLDVNGKWNLRKAKTNFAKLPNSRIEFIEQPVKNLEGLNKLAGLTKIKIAPDESVKNFKTAMQIIDNRNFEFIIIKPQVLGSIFDTLKIITRANSKGVKVIISSVFESVVGKSILYLLAAQTNHGYAHGLTANKIFENDLFEAPFKFYEGKIILTKNEFNKFVRILSESEYA